jgi:hypothetical protein
MFNSTNEYSFALRLEASGLTQVPVRFPSDEAWITHSAGCKTFFQSLGRGASTTTVETAKADLGLYQAIRCADAPDLEATEAGRIVELLKTFDVRSIDQEGDEFVITAAIHGAEVVLRLKAPTTRAVMDYRRAAFRLISLPHGRSQMTTKIQEAAPLFDKCLVSAEGYEGPIPVIHKERALSALIEHIESEVDGVENF